MAPLGTPYFTGCSAGGSGQIDVYLTITGGAVYHNNGYPDPPGTDFSTAETAASVWLGGAYQVGGYLNATAGQVPTYYRPPSDVSLDLVHWQFDAFITYPSRLDLWPPPVETSGLAAVTIGGFSTCGYGGFGYPQTEGSSGGGTILVSPFHIAFVKPSLTVPLIDGKINVAYGDQNGFYGFGLYLSATGFQGSTTFTFSGSGLPAGLHVEAVGGLIVGTPTVSGTFAVTLRATDASGYYHDQVFSLYIHPNTSVSFDDALTFAATPGMDGAAILSMFEGMALVSTVGYAAREGRGVPIVVPTDKWQLQRFELKPRTEESA